MQALSCSGRLYVGMAMVSGSMAARFAHDMHLKTLPKQTKITKKIVCGGLSENVPCLFFVSFCSKPLARAAGTPLTQLDLGFSVSWKLPVLLQGRLTINFLSSAEIQTSSHL